MNNSDALGMSAFDYHVLLALATGPLHGYAIKDAVASDSDGAVVPRAGSMYRVIARLMTSGLVVETDPPAQPEPHPGQPRRYYMLTPGGRVVLGEESRRLARASALATQRLAATQGRP